MFDTLYKILDFDRHGSILNHHDDLVKDECVKRGIHNGQHLHKGNGPMRTAVDVIVMIRCNASADFDVQ